MAGSPSSTSLSLQSPLARVGASPPGHSRPLPRYFRPLIPLPHHHLCPASPAPGRSLSTASTTTSQGATTAGSATDSLGAAAGSTGYPEPPTGDHGPAGATTGDQAPSRAYNSASRETPGGPGLPTGTRASHQGPRATQRHHGGQGGARGPSASNGPAVNSPRGTQGQSATFAPASRGHREHQDPASQLRSGDRDSRGHFTDGPLPEAALSYRRNAPSR